jgi:membrane carboxypeptidase/penicillin-binding protein PbpC
MEEKRRTIVGGRSRSNRLLENFPRSIEVLLKKARVDDAFRELLLQNPFTAAESIELHLGEQEINTLKNIPQSLLKMVIDNTPVPKQHVQTFRTAKKAAVLVLLLGTTVIVPPVTAAGVAEAPTFSTEQYELASERMAAVQRALEAYKTDHGRYPSTEEWLETLSPLAAYLPNSDLYDPWHRKFHYEDFKEGGKIVNYRLESIGLDINSPIDNIPCPKDTVQHLFLEESPINILYPSRDQVIRTELQIEFRAEHQNSKVLIDWYLDGDKVGQTVGNNVLSVEVKSGEHTLLLVDENDYSTSANFTVIDG